MCGKLTTFVCAFVLIAGTMQTGQPIQAKDNIELIETIAVNGEERPPISKPTLPELEKIEIIEPIELPDIEEIEQLEQIEIIEPEPQRTVAYSQPTEQYTPRNSTAGNTYTAGYCTWYVKNQRPDIPNGLGNANTWFSRAQAMGLATGSAPQVGAVATTTSGTYGHVAIVEAVNGDGTIVVSEMNFRGWNVVSSRTAPASDFLYIY